MKKQNIFIFIFIISWININAQLTEVINTGNVWPWVPEFYGNDLYFAKDITRTISKLDITDPTPSITDVISLDPDNEIFSLIINGNDMYCIPSYQKTIYKMDVSDPEPTLTEVLYVNEPGQLAGGAIKDNFLYFIIMSNTSSYEDRICKIDITDPTPTIIDVISTSAFGQIRNLVFQGNDLYINDTTYPSSIYKIDVNDTNPSLTLIINGDGGGELRYPTIYGNDLYFANQYENFIGKINLNGPPYSITNVVEVESPSGLKFKDNDLYITQANSSGLGRISKFTVTLSLEDNYFDKTIFISPNPSNNFIQISGLNETEIYKIFNVLGNEITNGVISNKEKINIQNLSNGLYFIKFQNKNTLKFIKN